MADTFAARFTRHLSIGMGIIHRCRFTDAPHYRASRNSGARPHGQGKSDLRKRSSERPMSAPCAHRPWTLPWRNGARLATRPDRIGPDHIGPITSARSPLLIRLGLQRPMGNSHLRAGAGACACHIRSTRARARVSRSRPGRRTPALRRTARSPPLACRAYGAAAGVPAKSTTSVTRRLSMPSSCVLPGSTWRFLASP